MSKKIAKIEDRFMDLTEIDQPTVITIYGRPGTGKTTIASTAPKPLMLIDIRDKGTESAKHPELEYGDITVFQVKTVQDVYDLYDYLLDNPKTFKSVVIDHLTALQDLMVDEVKSVRQVESVSQQMWGEISGQLKEVINLYKSLPDEGILPVFIAQDRTLSEDDDVGGQVIQEVVPGLIPSIARTLGSTSRVIAQAYLEEVEKKVSGGPPTFDIEWRLRLGPDPYYMTKVTMPRGAYCPQYLVDATIPDIIDIVNGNYRRPTKRRRRRKK